MQKFLQSVVLILIFSAQWVHAQNITERHWYFGANQNAFVYDKGARTATEVDHQATPFGTNGSTVIADKQKGNLLFYSDGEVIYDNQHQILPGLGADRLNADLTKIQPVVSTPLPGDSTRYLIFTNSGSAIEVTTVDASLTGNSTVNEFPRGDVEGAINQSTGITNTGELLKILESTNGQSFWLVTQDVTTLDLIVTEITAAGLGTPATYDVFPDSIAAFEATALAIKTDSLGATTLALSPKRINRNIVLLDFDPATGTPSFQQQLLNTGYTDTGATVIYDLEWSEDGSKLYYSRTGDDTNGGNIYQVDFTDSTTTLPPVVPALSNTVFRSYGLKRAPDGRIYHLYQDASSASPFQLGSINRPDSTVASGINYNNLVFDLDFAGTQFPEFAPSYFPRPYFTTLDFITLDTCEHRIAKFIAVVDPLPDNYFWNFGDGGFAFGPAVNHEYQSAGGPMVSLTVELDGFTQTVSKFVEIVTVDSLDLGNDTTICVDETLDLSAGNDGVRYIWSTGETDSVITVDTAGTYWVEKFFASGCSAYDEIEVTEYGVQSQRFNQWYFGEMAGLDFNTTPPTALVDANQMFSPEGCATISDESGQLLFYTNGSTVWNKEHNIMVNGTNIGGDSTAAQSAMILPFNEEMTMFYVFTTEEVYGDFTFNLKMSIVDMKKDTARGAVMVKNIPIVECSSERVTASGFTGTPYLLAHEYGNNNFRSYQINTNGVVGPLHSSAGEEHIFEEEPRATGYMRFAPGGNFVAVVIPGATNYVDLLDYDLTNGEVSNSRLIDIEEPGAMIYGLEFAPDVSRLYVTTSSKVIQYDLDSINSQNPATDIMATKFDGYATTLNTYGAMQTGPDGVIYIAIDGTTQLATISNPSGDDAGASFLESGVDLLGRTSRLGLPNFTQQVTESPQLPNISTTVACAGQETLFSGQGRDSSIEFYTWDFGDGTVIANLQNPDTSHVYTVDSTYIVTLTLSNRCDTDSVLTDTVTVFTIPEEPLVPTDTALCGGSVTLSAWNVDRSDLNYYWSSGDTTRQVTFNSPTVVDVAIISDFGCSSDTLTVFIGDGESFVDLGPDQTICQFDTLLLDANDPGPFFTWTENGVEIGDQRTQQVIASTPGDFSYAVEVINDFTGCIYRDTLVITVRPAPTASQANVINPECSQANGQFALQIDENGSFSYQLSGPVAAGPFTFDGPGETPPFTGLSSGSYTASITNSVTGCTRTEVFQLEDNAGFEMDAIAQNECVQTGDIQINFSRQIPAMVEINVFNQTGTSVFNGTEELRSSSYSVSDLDSGTYYVEVRDVSPPNCIQTDTVTLSVSRECYRTIFVPNAFSPNGNGQNEEWFAFPNEFVDQFQVYVFNRWGDLVYYSTNKNFRWDGTFEGRFVPQGTYAYRMLFTSTLEPEQGTLEQYGSVTVVK